MVGVAGGDGGPAAGLTTAAVRADYDRAAGRWMAGPERLYAVLARALLANTPVPVPGRRVLDLGSGTGVAGRAALAAGAAQVVAADLALAMLRVGLGRGGGIGASRTRLHLVAADAAALPFRDGSFDLVVAAFCVNHMPSVVAGLREARRVAPAIAASTFAAGWSHPAKDAVDRVLQASGFRPPAWYAALKQDIEPRVGDPEWLAAAAAAAGYRTVRVRTTMVETGVSGPAQLAAWRLGMAPAAAFLGAMDRAGQAAVRQAAERAVAEAGAGPLVVAMVVLAAG